MLSHNLKMFLTVTRSGGITEAARNLYISQPAVSQAIKNLERVLNVKLFHRDKKQGLILTDVGEKVRLIALEMEHLEEQLYQATYLENNFIGGNLRIGSLPILTSTLLPGYSSAVKKDWKSGKEYGKIKGKTGVAFKW